MSHCYVHLVACTATSKHYESLEGHKVYVEVSESKTNKENRLGVKAQYVKWLNVENKDGNDALKMSGRGGWCETRCKEAIKKAEKRRREVLLSLFFICLLSQENISSTSKIMLVYIYISR